MKELIEVIKKEIEFCETVGKGTNKNGPVFEEGFLAGLKQSLVLIELANKTE